MIAVIAIITAIISIITKAVNNLQYINLLPASSQPSDFFMALSPIFLKDKEKENSSEELRKLGNRIKTSLWIFYISLVIFFAYVSFWPF